MIEEWETDPISILAHSLPCPPSNSHSKVIEEWETDLSVLVPPLPCSDCERLLYVVAEAKPLEHICDRGDDGDHGDTLACASEIEVGTEVSASIEPGDPDVFSFSVTVPERVMIRSFGQMDVSLQILDACGLLLAGDDDSGLGANFLIVGDLDPGRYFLRVETLGSFEGPYRLKTTVWTANSLSGSLE